MTAQSGSGSDGTPPFEDAYTTTVPVRYADLDTQRRVNNAAYLTYVEESRVDYTRDVVGNDAADAQVLASLTVDFSAPITERGPVEVAVAVPSLGRTSLSMHHRLRAGGETVATAESRVVTIDLDTGDPRPIPETVRERITAYESR